MTNERLIEKALGEATVTPTGDEREALILDLKVVAGIMKFLGYKGHADTVLRAIEALHRTARGEPSEALLSEIEQRVYDENKGQIAGMAKALVRAGWDAAAGFRRTEVPTDDERETLARAVLEALVHPLTPRRGPAGTEYDFADRLVASPSWPFRRTEVPELSCALAAIERAKAYLTDVSETNEMRNRNAYGALKDITPEPQGEPSDTQVLAALNSYEAWSAEESLDMWGSDQVDRMRAALRVAWGVR